MERVQWYIRTYRCDNGIEYKTKFCVRETARVRSSYSKMRAAVRRAEKGATAAKTEAGRVLNSNFLAGRDYYLGLDYSPEGLAGLICRAGTDTRDAVYRAAEQNMMERYVKRLRRGCKAAGVPLRYFFITSDMDGRTMDEVRVHHHMAINAEAAEIAKALWTDGGTRCGKLYSHHSGDLQELADYMIGQARQLAKNAKRYHPSRNLQKPICGRPVKARNPDAELAVPKGCQKIWRSESRPGRPQQLRYFRPSEAAPEWEDE